jgi:hypothetical protein
MTSISDLPDFSDTDILLLQDTPQELIIEKEIETIQEQIQEPSKLNINSIISEENLLVFILVLIIMFKPTNNYIQLLSNRISPFANDFSTVIFTSSCILIIYLLVKNTVLPHIKL